MLYDWRHKVRLPFGCKPVSTRVEQQRPRKEEDHPLDCICAWAGWVKLCGARTEWSFMWRLPSRSSLFPSSFLSFSLFFKSLSFFLFLFLFFYLSPLFSFFLTSHFFSSKLGLTPSWNKDTPLDGRNLQCDAQRFPPHLDFCVKVKCAIGVSFWVSSNSKEHQSVQLMQSSCSRASYVPCSS